MPYERFREMRTIAVAIDNILSGKQVEAPDVLISRFKSAQKTQKDGNHHTARWLEVVASAEDGTSLDQAEEELITSVEAAHIRNEKHLATIRDKNKSGAR